ncbi:hypothetical protein LINPERHAP1_LOCUS26984 [Linum perenne]
MNVLAAIWESSWTAMVSSSWTLMAIGSLKGSLWLSMSS